MPREGGSGSMHGGGSFNMMKMEDPGISLVVNALPGSVIPENSSVSSGHSEASNSNPNSISLLMQGASRLVDKVQEEGLAQDGVLLMSMERSGSHLILSLYIVACIRANLNLRKEIRNPLRSFFTDRGIFQYKNESMKMKVRR